MVRFGDIKIKTTVKEGMQTGELEVFVKAYPGHEKAEETADRENIFLWAQLADEQGQEADRIFPLALQEQMQFCMRVEKPELWDAERCYLYDLVLELRSEKNGLLESVTKKIAFRRWEKTDGIRFLNGKAVKFVIDSAGMADIYRGSGTYDGIKEKEMLGRTLTQMKLSGKNAWCVAKEDQSPLMCELCLEYGIYLLGEMPDERQVKRTEEVCGFELQVVEQGVLVENHCDFADADIYELRYGIWSEKEPIQRGKTKVKIAAGSSRFVELPFTAPREAGIYRYRAALCLEKDTLWAKEGYEIASGESLISNLWLT